MLPRGAPRSPAGRCPPSASSQAGTPFRFQVLALASPLSSRPPTRQSRVRHHRVRKTSLLRANSLFSPIMHQLLQTPAPPPLELSHTHALTHSRPNSLTHSLTHAQAEGARCASGRLSRPPPCTKDIIGSPSPAKRTQHNTTQGTPTSRACCSSSKKGRGGPFFPGPTPSFKYLSSKRPCS